MSRSRTLLACAECDTPHAKWTGRCTGCGAWNSLGERIEPASGDAPGGGRAGVTPVRIAEVADHVGTPRPTGLTELDRVLGGGIVPGSVTLLGGEPGIGKSTLLLQLLAWWPGTALYVSAEESAPQVRRRAERLQAVRPDLWLSCTTSLPDVFDAVERIGPDLLVVDSIQTVADPALDSTPGSVAQVRGCAGRLVDLAKSKDLPVVLVGHVTKDGGLAGPRALEHIVDTVLSFEGDRHHAVRLLRATKHRFGPTGELGLLEMGSTGLIGVPDASGWFLSDRRPGVAGSAIVPTADGPRPLVVEIQALTVPAPPGIPVRRHANGVDGGRLALLLAVLQRRAGLPVAAHDVHVSAVGGVRVAEPGTDLAVCLAVASALTDRPLPDDLAVLGEVGLGGELRQVARTDRRLAEAARLGFTTVLVPGRGGPAEPRRSDVRVLQVDTVRDALVVTGLVGTR